MAESDLMRRWEDRSGNGWATLLVHALPAALLVLLLFFYWFAVADRYLVFLYYHDMGRYYPDTSPFSRVTASRYWMAGLVAAGAVLVLYAGATWLVGRMVRTYEPPAWWRVWGVDVLPLAVGIPLITMGLNTPTLPVVIVIQTTSAALLGLGLALTPGKLAARQPRELAWLVIDGGGIALFAYSIAMLDRVVWFVETGRLWAIYVVAGALVGALLLLMSMTGLRRWRRMSIPNVTAILVAGLCFHYLFLPLVHHVAFTDGYFYITDSDNFFARFWWWQAIAWAAAAGVAAAVTSLRRHWAADPA